MKSVSIIIPTINEEKLLEKTLKQLYKCKPFVSEIVGVDAGSIDDTVNIFYRYRAKVLQTKVKGRAAQMNAGARFAKGEILVFLHADTLVPEQLVSIVNDTLADKKVALAAFESIMKGEETQKFISAQNYSKTFLVAFMLNPQRTLFNGFRMLFGDQVMFCRKSDFDRVGGFNEAMNVMEDADLSIKMNRLGKIRQIKEKVYSSDRRVQKWGVMSGYFRYLSILGRWYFSKDRSRFNADYEDVR